MPSMPSWCWKTIRLKWPPRRPGSVSTRFRLGGGDERKTIESLLRGSIIAALDEAYCDGELGRMLGRDSEDYEVAEQACNLFYVLMCDLFPREYIDESLPERGLFAGSPTS